MFFASFAMRRVAGSLSEGSRVPASVISWGATPAHSFAPIEPSVTVIIAAYNEEKDIARKLEMVLSLDYPAERRQIIVASDHGQLTGTKKVDVIGALRGAGISVANRFGADTEAGLGGGGGKVKPEQILPKAKKREISADQHEAFEKAIVRAANKRRGA